MRQFEPITLKPQYYEEIEKAALRVMVETLFMPMLDAVKVDLQLTNSVNKLAESIKSGAVWYDNGKFYGNFNAEISKELRGIGAKYNKHTKSWTFSGTLPPEISTAHVIAVSQYGAARAAAITQLGKISTESVLTGDFMENVYKRTLARMDKDIYEAASKIMIAPKMTEEARDAIAKEWADNMQLNIKGWLDDNVKKLRSEIEGNTMAGNRAKAITEHIVRSYQVSERKAQFLARQETSLLMSKFREQRYKALGVVSYRWSTSKDERVRKDHKDLHGKIFRWDDPPIVNKKKGTRAHAGEDFGCRCVAIPVLQ